MLTGRQAFDTGETVSDAVAAILKSDPDWSALPADTPDHIRTLLRRCLQKDPQKRLPHIGVARIEIEEGLVTAVTTSGGGSAASEVGGPKKQGPPYNRWQRVLPWAVATLLLFVAVGLGALLYLGLAPADTRVTRTVILPPDNARWAVARGGARASEQFNAPANRFTLSPDGRRLAFLVTEADGRTRIWVRPLDAVSAQPLAGTEGALRAAWSPDSRFLAYVAEGKLKKVDASGGPSSALADTDSNAGISWNGDDVLLFTTAQGPIFRVSASGGAPAPVTTLDAAVGDSLHWHPFFLPDGRHFLYCAVGTSADPRQPRAVYVGSLDPDEKPRLLLQGGSNAQYASGHVLFMRETTVMAQPFDPDRLELTGEALPLVEQVQIGGPTVRIGAFSVSATNVLVYQTGGAEVMSQLVWFDRTGKQLGTLGEPADQIGPELSPEGSRAIVSVSEPAGTTPARNLWVYDVAQGSRTRFTFNPAVEFNAIWSPDGSSIIFNSQRAARFDLYRKAASGAAAEELLLSDDIDKVSLAVTPDNRILSYSTGTLPKTRSDSGCCHWLQEASPCRSCRLHSTNSGIAFRPTASGWPTRRANRADWKSMSPRFQTAAANGRCPRPAASGRAGAATAKRSFTCLPRTS